MFNTWKKVALLRGKMLEKSTEQFETLLKMYKEMKKDYDMTFDLLIKEHKRNNILLEQNKQLKEQIETLKGE